MRLDELRVPIVQSPLSGGASTPRLAAAVAEAGALGFLATGYKPAAAVRADIDELRTLTSAPFGVNVFAPPNDADAADDVAAYAARLQTEAERYGTSLGEPRHDDDDYAAKLELVKEIGVAIVSFTFGCPPTTVVDELHQSGTEVWVTVTNPSEAVAAAGAGADALIVQGFEAGGHRGYFADGPDAEDIGLLALLRLTARAVELPLVAAGGIADGAAVAAVLSAGAAAAQIGTALMLTPEAGTSAPHRAALKAAEPAATGLTRAFSGRTARGIVNRFMAEHSGDAPFAYPDVHHLTTPIRAASRQAGDPEAINLWAGQAYPLASDAPAAEVIQRLDADARVAIAAAMRRLERDGSPSSDPALSPRSGPNRLNDR